jgi:hypothetical protein
LFRPHLNQLLEFLSPLILLSTDSGSTPTEAKPSSGSSVFPPPPETAKMASGGDNEEMDDDKQDMRKGALEFMMTLSEADPVTVKNIYGWVAVIVRGCLEGMGVLHDDDLEEWLAADVRRRLCFLLA